MGWSKIEISLLLCACYAPCFARLPPPLRGLKAPALRDGVPPDGSTSHAADHDHHDALEGELSSSHSLAATDIYNETVPIMLGLLGELEANQQF